jgi:Flp pilus assembly protein TadD
MFFACGLDLDLGRLVRIALVAAAGASLGGCVEMAGLVGPTPQAVQATPAGDDQLRAAADALGKRYQQSPGDKTVSIDYARALRAVSRYSEAAAVMRTAAIQAPYDYEVLGEYGKALADSGELAQAQEVLTRAYPEDQPDWAIMSVQGAVDDELGDHASARKFYAEALKIAPGEAHVLNNLGLSYALTKQLPLAEATLRQASEGADADARVRNNLALVLSLERKSAQAKDSRRDMSAEAARGKVGAMQQRIANHASAKTRPPSPKTAVASE